MSLRRGSEPTTASRYHRTDRADTKVAATARRAAPHGARELRRLRGRGDCSGVRGGASGSIASCPTKTFALAPRRRRRDNCSDAIDATRARNYQNNYLLVGLAKLRHDGVLPREELLPVVQDLDLLLVEVAEVRPAPVDVLGLEGHLG